MSTTRNIYALLVGIDAYQHPVKPLGGCCKDVTRIKEFLLSHYGATPTITSTALGADLPVTISGSVHLCTLEDERATYRNVIRGFREHLRRATPEDVVWFHFSGHGTEHFTADAFRASIEPNGKDQNLICYFSSGQPEAALLADKELAVLLHEVATANGTADPPHILVSLDCCHSGSGTRDIESGIQPRTTHLHRIKVWSEAKAAGKVRPLESYLDGYFTRANLGIPLSRHMLLSACTSIQTAGDTNTGGIFTTNLIDALEEAEGELNYADLFVRTRSAVQQVREAQLPQFETLSGFDPYVQFLDGRPLGTPDRFEVVREGEVWLVKCGAIHGLPVTSKQPIEVVVQRPAPDNRPLGKGVLTAIGAQKSQLAYSGATPLDPDTDYQAVLRHLPLPPWRVVLRGDPAPLQRLIDSWEDGQGVTWTRTEDPTADLAVEATDGQYRIYELRLGRCVFAGSQRDSMDEVVFNNLTKIVRWDRTRTLHNPKSAIRDRVNLSVEVILAEYARKNFFESEVELIATPQTLMLKDGILFGGFLPRVQIHDTSQELYCYLLHLRSDYSIQSYEGEIIFRPREFPGQSEVILPLLKQHKGWGLEPGESEATSYFQLLVTTESLDYHQLLQGGLGGDRSAAWEWQPMGVSDDWCSMTMKLTLRLPEG